MAPNATIPTDAVGLTMNVTAVRAERQTFWTIWPEGEQQPEASSLNPAPGQPPTPNAVTTSLSSAGEFNVFNNRGTVGMVIDVNGYYTNATLTELTDQLAAAAATAGILDAREPFAVEGTESDNLDLTSVPQPYVSVAVTAPAAGQVTLNSTARVQHAVDGGDILCAIYEADAIPALAVADDTPSIQFWETSLPSDQGSLSGTRTFDIAADTTVTYSLACEETTGGGIIWTGNLTAVFTPVP